VATGVSCLTPWSPAFSIATDTGVAALAIYRRAAFAIHMLTLGAEEPVDASAGSEVPRLPPVNASARRDLTPRSGGGAGTAPAEPRPLRAYTPRLSLEGISQSAFSIGMDRFGAVVGAGIGATFSDMLNTHWLVTAVQLSSGLDGNTSWRDTAALGIYLNQVHRWNWGVIGSYAPTYSGIRTTVEVPDTSPVSTVTPIRQIERAGALLTSYPLNRARRVEFQGGVSRVSFDHYTIGLDGDVQWSRAADTLTLGLASAAFVGDTASFGPTSPVRGERYRLELAPTFGTVRYLNVLADYRRYVMPIPFYTVAARALHMGRYGSGADDPRVLPLYVGYPTLVRGYALDSDITAQCVSVLSSGCAELDRMLGSRVAVGNVELRFPLLRPLGMSSAMYGPVPVEVALFVDGGLAWRATSAIPVGLADAVWSTGVTLRTSVLGFGLSQFDLARPLQNPVSGWVFQFHLAPGF
jgi:hypothetical protein